jgi:hypothetical protein
MQLTIDLRQVIRDKVAAYWTAKLAQPMATADFRAKLDHLADDVQLTM